MDGKGVIDLLNCILKNIPTHPITGELDQDFRIGDLTEHLKSNRSLDSEVANFLIKRKFATLIQYANPFAGNKESRTLLLTETGKKLHKAGGYAEFIGLTFWVILKVFNIDLYCWWVTLSAFWKEVIKVGGWAIIAAGIFEIAKEIYKSLNKH